MIRFIMISTLATFLSCTHKPKTTHENSGYRPVVLPQALPSSPSTTEPGSTTSPQVQQLPKASP